MPQSLPDPREKRLGGAHIAREDRRRQSLRHAIVLGDRVVERVERRHVEDRCEGLALHDVALRRQAGDDRRLDPEPGAWPHVAAADDRAARSGRLGERAAIVLHRRRVDQRSNQRRRVQRIVDAHLRVTRGEPSDDRVVALAGDDQPACRRAALACGANRAEHHRGHDEIDVQRRRSR
jgi:hypothetical protein